LKAFTEVASTAPAGGNRSLPSAIVLQEYTWVKNPNLINLSQELDKLSGKTPGSWTYEPKLKEDSQDCVVMYDSSCYEGVRMPNIKAGQSRDSGLTYNGRSIGCTLTFIGDAPETVSRFNLISYHARVNSLKTGGYANWKKIAGVNYDFVTHVAEYGATQTKAEGKPWAVVPSLIAGDWNVDRAQEFLRPKDGKAEDPMNGDLTPTLAKSEAACSKGNGINKLKYSVAASKPDRKRYINGEEASDIDFAIAVNYESPVEFFSTHQTLIDSKIEILDVKMLDHPVGFDHAPFFIRLRLNRRQELEGLESDPSTSDSSHFASGHDYSDLEHHLAGIKVRSYSALFF